MKIGLYGGVANNMYVFAKAFSKQGQDVCFIRDRNDHYPFSQPAWEDIPWVVEYEQLAKMANWSWPKWTKWEDEVGWQAPAWLADPLQESSSCRTILNRVIGPLGKAFFYCIAQKRTHWPAVLNLMVQCDVLLVCGIEGTLLASLSGRPFVIFPHGGDIRTAAGLHPPQSWNPRDWIIYWKFLGFIRRAYLKAMWVGSHDPAGFGGYAGAALKKLKDFRTKPLFIPLPFRQRLPRPSRLDSLSNFLKKLGLTVPDAEYIGFIPSRVDFLWKGHDHFLRAFSRVTNKQKIHLIVSGWGQNYHDMKAMVREMKLDHHITFLPCVLSKPLLYDFYKSSDFVVDQFFLGIYGTSALESMSCGTPVIMWIEEKAFRDKGWEIPPVLKAKDEEDISDILDDIVSGHVDLEEYSRAAHGWVGRVHGEESATVSFLREIENDMLNFRSHSFETLFKSQTIKD